MITVNLLTKPPRYRVLANVGFFWPVCDIDLGAYRYRWLAQARGIAHQLARPWREFLIVKEAR